PGPIVGTSLPDLMLTGGSDNSVSKFRLLVEQARQYRIPVPAIERAARQRIGRCFWNTKKARKKKGRKTTDCSQRCFEKRRAKYQRKENGQVYCPWRKNGIS